MEKMAQQNQIVAAIRKFFDATKWKYKFDEDNYFFHSGIKLKSVFETATLSVIVGSTFYCVYYYIPIKIDENSRPQITDLIARINWKIGNGSFDIDSEDNSLTYKVFVNCDSLTPSQEVIQDSLFVPAVMIDTYGNSIIDVANLKITPIEAIRELEDQATDKKD